MTTDSTKFEQSRILQLQQERLFIQKKTFTKWINSFLSKVNLSITDLFSDLCDGRRLLKLLEMISGERVARPNTGRMRVHRVENVHKCLAFLHTKVRLESIGAEDIVDGNPTLILGLIWTIILRFQIQEIEIDVDEDAETSEKKSAKDALLLWCQRQTAPHGVRITDFAGSWRDGRGFLALADARADRPLSNAQRLELAFRAAEQKGIPRLLDVEDVDTARPDEKSILTYVAAFYHAFAKVKNEKKSGRRIANILSQLMSIAALQQQYLSLASELRAWAQRTTTRLRGRAWENSLDGMQRVVVAFTAFRTLEKPPRYTQRLEMCSCFFSLQTQLQALQQPPFVPPEGLALADVEALWAEVEREEHETEVALRAELRRQERLELLWYKFQRKLSLRNTYIAEMLAILADRRYADGQVGAAARKHEAVALDVAEREQRVSAVLHLGDVLLSEGYHQSDLVKQQQQSLREKWLELLSLVRRHGMALRQRQQAVGIADSIAVTNTSIQEIEQLFTKPTTYLPIESQLQQHYLHELQLTAIGENVNKLAQVVAEKENDKEQFDYLHPLLKSLTTYYAKVQSLATDVRESLLQSHYQYQQQQQISETGEWLLEKQREVATVVNNAGISIVKAKEKMLVVEQEVKTRQSTILALNDTQLTTKYDELIQSITKQQHHLHSLEKLLQLRQEKDELATWLAETHSLICNFASCNDEAILHAQLRRLQVLEFPDLNLLRRAVDELPLDLRSDLLTDLTKLDKQQQTLKALATAKRSQLEETLRDIAFNSECGDLERAINELENEDWTGESEDFSALTKCHSLALRLETLRGVFPTRERLSRAAVALQTLRQTREAALKGAAGRRALRAAVAEAQEWVGEKVKQMECLLKPNMDINTVEQLLRKHEQLDRELTPVGEKVKRVQLLAQSVTATEEIQPQLDVLMKQWNNLLLLSQRVKDSLEAQRRRQAFETALRRCRAGLCMGEEDLSELQRLAEEAAHNCEDSEKDEIFNELSSFLLAYAAAEAQQKERRKRELLHRRALALFRDADSLEHGIHACEVVLENDLSEKTLTNITTKLQTLDTKIASFLQQTLTNETLILTNEQLEEKKQNIIKRQAILKQKVVKKQQLLQQKRALSDFCSQFDEVDSWLDEKMKIVKSCSKKKFEKVKTEILGTSFDGFYQCGRDLINNIISENENENSNEKTTKIEEKNNNSKQKTNKIDEKISENITKNVIQDKIDQIQLKHDTLQQLITTKSTKITRIQQLRNFNNDLILTIDKINNIKQQLKYDCPDLSTCKRLLLKHQMLEMDFGAICNKVKQLNLENYCFENENIEKLSIKNDNLKQITKENKNSSSNNENDQIKEKQNVEDVEIENLQQLCLKNHKKCQELSKETEVLLQSTKAILEKHLKMYKFAFEVSNELQWIVEKKLSDDFGGNLYEVQLLIKKHKKVEDEINRHEAVIQKLLTKGEELKQEMTSTIGSTQIEEQVVSLDSAWRALCEEARVRARRLQQALAFHQLVVDAAEVEAWAEERLMLVNSGDCGRDRESTLSLLAKHRALELQIDTYDAIVEEMGRGVQQLIATNMLSSLQSKAALGKHQLVVQQLRGLRAEARARRGALLLALRRADYEAAAQELRHWLSMPPMDYGYDYEHLLVIRERFETWANKVDVAADRFKQCEDLSKPLTSSDSPYKEEITLLHSQLTKDWLAFQAELSQRRRALAAAAEVHRFHRDAAEALSWCGEKAAALPLRKIEEVETELVAVEAQVQVLIEEAVHLQKQYPNNAAQIKHQQNLLISTWTDLERRAHERKEELARYHQLQEFSKQVKEIVSWAKNLAESFECITNDKDCDYNQLQVAKNEHEAIKNEIEAREETFKQVYEIGENIIQAEDEKVKEEVEEQCNTLIEIRRQLHVAWGKKRNLLDQQIDLVCFLKDAQQLDNICNQQQVMFKVDPGETVEQVLLQVKKHESLEKLFIAQEEKLSNLQQCAEKLLNQNHFKSDLIKQRLHQIINKRQLVKEASVKQKQKLDDCLLYAQFMQNVSEVELLIQEKRKKLNFEVNFTDSLEDKVKRLQRHQTFQAEISANESQIHEIKLKGKKLLEKKHKKSEEIHKTMSKLLHEWEILVKDSENRGKGLEEAQDILDFNNEMEKMETWIRDKEMLIQANEKGKDYEHCITLQRKLDDVDRVDEAKIKMINALADKLIKKNIPIQHKRDSFVSKWESLQGSLSKYRKMLNGALEIHLFNRDVNDTIQRLSEKSASINADEDNLKDLFQVQICQRKQEVLEREMSAIEAKIDKHNDDSHRLVTMYPQEQSSIKKKILELSDCWFHLLELNNKRKSELELLYEKHKFLSELKDLDIWVLKKIEEMQVYSQMDLHVEKKAEIDGRQNVFANLEKEGLRICQKTNDSDISNGLMKLKHLQQLLQQAWNDKQSQLIRNHQIECFKEQADQIDNWLSIKEAFLNNEDVGESLSSVEDLLRKHQDFSNTLNAQWQKVDDLEKFVTKLPPIEEIKQRFSLIISRTNRLKQSLLTRKQKLVESKQLQKFLCNVYEVQSWLKQKMQIACDENYREQINLQSKIQKHAVFDSEIHANKSRVENVISEGLNLLPNHFASTEIQSQVDYLQSEWQQLMEMSELKKNRLHDSYQFLLFTRSLDEFESWMNDIETQLKSNDLGKDLASVNNLIKKHTALENDYIQRSENCDVINQSLVQFKENNHFMIDEIVERVENVLKRYKSLDEPITIRHDDLENSLLLQQFLRDCEDEIQWLNDRELLAVSEELGNGLVAVQRLQKKHQALETEVMSREAIVATLVSRGNNLARGGHFAADKIGIKTKELQEQLVRVRDLASIRKLRLQDAFESQTYYTEANEASTWLKEKLPLASSQDFGKDEDSVETLIRRLDNLSYEVQSFESTITRLNKSAHDLIQRKHFDCDKIQITQDELEQQWTQLQELVLQREQRLKESLKYFAFVRQSEEITEWILEQTLIAASEDYGSDVEHIEILIQAFDVFLSGLTNSEQRITSCIENGKLLIKEMNSDSDKISNRILEVKQQWSDLQELAFARQEALYGAKQVHVFDRTADETIQWILEKQSFLHDPLNQDLETIQTQLRRHLAFEAELVAVKEQIEAVDLEARRLCATFPDAREHVEVKQEDAMQAWIELVNNVKNRKEMLKQAVQVQTYFDEYRDLMAWINEILAKITTPELAQDVSGAEALILQHNEHKAEIDARNHSFDLFYQTGNQLMEEKHFLSNEIEEKINVLKQRKSLLEQTWENRKRIYIENLDTQEFKRDADALEDWLSIRERILYDENLGDSIVQVEELIRKHEDFEKTILAQEEKFHSLHRITLLEQAFKHQKEQERIAREAEKQRLELQLLEQRKRQEMERITNARRDVLPLPLPTTTNLQKSNSDAHMFSSQRQAIEENQHPIKRAASVKPPKRTPSFTTRRRVDKALNKEEVLLPPTDIQGNLERKQVCLPGGKRSPSRSWKTFYSVLCGQLLCFFKNQSDFLISKAAAPPIGIFQARCAPAKDYTKRQWAFRVWCRDGAEFLFVGSSESQVSEWLRKIDFHANLAPSQQLLSYDSTNTIEIDASSTTSSRTSSPDSQMRTSPYLSEPAEEAPPIPPRAPVAPVVPVQLRHPPQQHFEQFLSQQNDAGQHRHFIRPVELPPPLPDYAPPVSRSSKRFHHHQQHDSVDVPPSDHSTVGEMSRPASLPVDFRSTDNENSNSQTSQPKRNRMLSGIFSRKKKTTQLM